MSGPLWFRIAKSPVAEARARRFNRTDAMTAGMVAAVPAEAHGALMSIETANEPPFGHVKHQMNKLLDQNANGTFDIFDVDLCIGSFLRQPGVRTRRVGLNGDTRST